MKLPAYPRYKPSGVEWLGDVPEHWGVARIKHLAEVRQGIPKGRDYAGAVTVDCPYLRVANVQDGYLDLTDVATISVLPQEVQRFSLQAGDVLMNEGGDCDKLGRGTVWAGQISPCLHQNHVFSVRPGGKPWLSRWISLWTQGTAAKTYFLLMGKQTTNLASISSTSISELPVIVPPVPEQRAIADFLDRATAKIDTLVAKKRMLLDRLKEKRTALISRTVTRGLPPAAARAAGLDPHPKLKPSGIPWLGDVPEYWQVKPLGRLVRFRGGATPDKSKSEYWDGEIPWVSPKDMKSPRIADVTDHVSLDALNNSPLTMLPVKSVLIVVRGMILAHTFPVAITDAPVTINQDMKALTVGRDMEAEFLLWLLVGAGHAFVALADESAHGTRKLESEVLAKTRLTVPPLPEQRAIVTYLVAETARLDALVAAVETAIERLQEYRTALITAAVTGKVDVRTSSRLGNSALE